MARKKKTELPQTGQPMPETKESRERAERVKELEKWRSRVARARKLRGDWEREYKVEECERFFLGQQHPRNSKDLVFNHFRATARTMKPSLFYTAPKFYVRPKPNLAPPAEETNAAIGEGVLEAIGNQDDNLKDAASLALWQAFFRIGVLKSCFDPKLEPNPQAGQPIYVENENGPVLKDGEPVPMKDPLTGKVMVEPDDVLTDEAYHYAYVDARHMLLPDEGADPHKWTWIGEEITVDLDDAKADTRFPQSIRESFTSNCSTNEDGRSTKPAKDTEPKFRYVELYDLKRKRLKILADGLEQDDFLLDQPVPYGIEDHPYALCLLGDPITGPEPSPWPVPLTRWWLDLQKEYNTNRKQIANASKRAARKGIYYPNSFDNVDEAMKVMQSPEDMEWALCTDPQAKPEVLAEPPLSSDVYKHNQLLMLDWRIVTGQTGARQGMSMEETATEATFVERAANLRDTDLQDAVNSWLSKAGRKMFQLVKGTLTMDLWVQLRSFSDTEFLRYVERTMGVPGAVIQQLETQFPGFKDLIKERVGKQQWRRITREQLTFEADVTVVPGSARPKNLEAERGAWFDFLKLLGQFPQIALSRELMKETASKLGDGLISERAIDELHSLAKQMVEINANQAGRNQGGGNNPGAGTGSTAGVPDLASLIQGQMAGVS